MAKKQAIVNETAAAAKPARVAKPRVPRVKAAQHREAVAAEPAVKNAAATTNVSAENPHDAIARIAYSLFEARGNQSGSEVEDWLRAEQKYQELTAK